MNIVLGATGQVGGAVIDNLIKAGAEVRGIIRDPEDAHALADKGAQVGIADGEDQDALVAACKEGTTIFVITPESFKTNDMLGDTRKLVENYRAAILKNGIKKIVGLSSMGGNVPEGNGNLGMSYILEHGFEGVDAQKIFIRPAYYYSNWMAYLPSLKDTGILPTFFPAGFRISMISPLDVAKFASEKILETSEGDKIYELPGPDELSAQDIAESFSKFIGSPVKAQQIPENKWGQYLEDMGFSIDAINNFIEMTKYAIEGESQAPTNDSERVKQEMKFEEFLEKTAKRDE